jgi:two-component system LytT family response regulator
MKAVIIEDEKKNCQQLRSLLTKNCPHVSIIGEGIDADSGLNLVRTLQPDLVFLDIQMPGKSGFDMLAELGSHPFEVIFVSGYDQYGVQAIKFSALDYLLKPVKSHELVHAVHKAELASSRKQSQEKIDNLLSVLNTDKPEHRIGLALMNEIRFVNVSDIIRCESTNSYTNLYMKDKEKLSVSKGIYEFDTQLSPYGFIRCSQSNLVNHKYIKSLLKSDTICELLLTDGTKVLVSVRKREYVKNELLKK